MRVALTQGAYTARSIIADCQRSINLYAELNPQDAPAPVTHYPTPGLVRLLTFPDGKVVRGVYRASNGNLYAVCGKSVYSVASNWTYSLLGTIADGPNPVSMADNGISLFLVDGTTAGYTVNLASNAFAAVSDPNFYGADRVDFVDTYFLFNQPGTNKFYISLSNSTAFNGLDLAGKIGYPDPLQAVIVMHREVWLIGQLTTEIWYNSGAADFTFQQMPGAFIEHGCAAKYSVTKYDLSVFWLSQDQQGNTIVLKGSNYQAARISTHAIETAIGSYSTISDAIGYTYQQGGHAFYVLTFPTAGKTWAYDMATELWHERAYSDPVNGSLTRHRGNCSTFAYGVNVVGDYVNGALYSYDLNTYTDDGRPIRRIRSFPHLLNDGKRVFYRQFIADMEVGTAAGTVDGTDPEVWLRWSDTRGASWSNPILGTMGAAGEYLTSIQFQRLGMARDRVFELSWSAAVKTALNGAFIDSSPAAT